MQLSAEVVHATASQAEEAQLLLNEYYADVGVIDRDTPQSVQKFLSGADCGFWIAYVDGTPAGCVALRPLDTVSSAGECKRLYVRAQFRRRGIAESLLDALEEHAESSGLAWVYLDSKDDLQAAIALYLRRGYVNCPRYNQNVQATVFLRKRITV